MRTIDRRFPRLKPEKYNVNLPAYTLAPAALIPYTNHKMTANNHATNRFQPLF